MPKLDHDQDHAADFVWPEPVIIDILCERYQTVARPERTRIARLQGDALRELYAGRPRRAHAVRVELLACCAANRVGSEQVSRADLAVLWELTQIAAARFRNSPRLRSAVCLRIEAALDQLRTKGAPGSRPNASQTTDALQPAAATG